MLIVSADTASAGEKKRISSHFAKNITIKLSSFAENLCEKNICYQNLKKNNILIVPLQCAVLSH